VSTNTLLRIIQDLISERFFEYHGSNPDFELELHLQCIVSGLRLFSRHGIYPASGSVSFEVFDKLFDRLCCWQVDLERRAETKGLLDNRNYNAEFLLVFAKDLVSSLPNDRTFTQTVLKRVLTAGPTIGSLVHSHLIVLALLIKCSIARTLGTL